MDPFTTVAAYAAPTLLNLGANLFRNNKPNATERRLSKYATMFDTEASAPVTANSAYRSGKKIIDRRDRDNRRAIDSRSAASGMTDEAKIATIQASNQGYDDALNQLFQNAQRYRDMMRSRSLQAYGMLDQAKANRDAQFENDWNRLAQPVGKAASTFLLSQMFDEPEKKWKPRTPAKLAKAPALPTVPYPSIFNS